MFRNLSRRVEVATPVTSRAPKEKLWEFLDISLRDCRQAWILNSDGSYSQLRPEGPAEGPETIGTQQTMMELTRSRSAEGERGS